MHGSRWAFAKCLHLFFLQSLKDSLDVSNVVARLQSNLATPSTSPMPALL